MGTELGVKEFTPILSDFTDGKNTKLFEEDLKSKSKLEKLLVGATGQTVDLVDVVFLKSSGQISSSSCSSINSTCSFAASGATITQTSLTF
ncbi:hypothetical protein ScalyP_jg1707 [Parmales sp. scaly parma]|nr:hypothetical protein ScalyP_jg1707 [Parmales sp. scaly parma]